MYSHGNVFFFGAILSNPGMFLSSHEVLSNELSRSHAFWNVIRAVKIVAYKKYKQMFFFFYIASLTNCFYFFFFY